MATKKKRKAAKKKKGTKANLAKKDSPKSKSLTKVEDYIKNKSDNLSYQIDEYARSQGPSFLEIENGDQRSEIIGKWVLENIVLPQFPKTKNLGELLDSCWVDQSGDKEIDFIAVLEDEVIILQSKVHEITTKSLEYTKGCISRISPGNGFKNDTLEKIAAKIKWNHHRFFVFYSTLGEATHKLREEQNGPITCLPNGLGKIKEASFQVLDRKVLSQRWDQMCGQGEIPEKITLPLVDGQLLDIKGEVPVKIGVTTGTALQQANEATNKGDLFIMNFRKGFKSPYNDKIRKSGKTKPGKFLAFNNGVTILTKKTEVSGDMLTLYEPQIVNGAQTTTNLEYMPENALEKINIQFKVVETEGLKLQAYENNDDPPIMVKETVASFTNELISASNTQNALAHSDKAANLPLHKSLVANFKAQSYTTGSKTRHILYIHKKSEINTNTRKSSTQVKFKEFLEWVYALRGEPSEFMTIKGEAIYDADNENSFIFKLFGDESTGKIKTSVDFPTFQNYAGAYWIAKCVKSILSERVEYKGKDMTRRASWKLQEIHVAERVHMLLATTKLIYDRIYPKENYFALHYSPGWAHDSGSREYKNCKTILLLAFQAAEDAFSSHKSLGHSPDTWKKRPESFKLIKDKIGLMDEDRLTRDIIFP